MFPCYVIFVYCLQLSAFLNADDFDDPPSPTYECRGIQVGDTVFMKPTGPPQNPADNDPRDFVPFKVLFLIDPELDKADQDRLEKLSNNVSQEMQQIMKGPRLNEIRFRRYPSSSNPDACRPRVCARVPIPGEYSLECRTKNGVVVPDPNVTSEPSDEVKKMNSEGRYSLVVLVAVFGKGWLIGADQSICPPQVGIVAQANLCEMDEVTKRPDHGRVIWCHKPSNLTEDHAFNTFFHETLHITMPQLVGALYPDNQCFPEIGETHGVSCEGKTWQVRTADSWLLQNGTNIKFPTYFVTTGKLPALAQDHLQCQDVPGAALNMRVEQGVLGPDFGHWNERYFPEDILTSITNPARVVTNVTLAALDAHSKWYTVNFSYAHPLKRSRGAGCDFLTKSCHHLFNEKRPKVQDEPIDLPPYCDDPKPEDRLIPTSLCSQDHREWYICRNDMASSAFCRIKIVGTAPIYDHWICDKTRSLNDRSLQARLGGSAGADTICMTIVNAPRYNRSMVSVCVKHECDPASSTLMLHLKPFRPKDQTQACPLNCTAAQSNKVVNLTVGPSCGGGLPGKPVTVICPHYDQVCGKSMTTTTSAANRITQLGACLNFQAFMVIIQIPRFLWYRPFDNF